MRLCSITAVVCLLLSAMVSVGCAAAVESNAGDRLSSAGHTNANIPTARPTVDAATLPTGVGILGDSGYDEYQGSDNRGGDYHAVTLNLVELLVHARGLNLGAWGQWGEPRRQGYEYNWARSGATSTTMIEMGQHTGLAAQVREGKVTHVFIGIGANDFSPGAADRYGRIYRGALSEAQVNDKINKAIANVTLAVDTLLEAGARHVAVALFPQWEMDAGLLKTYPNATGRKRVADTVDAINVGIAAMAASRGVAIVDPNTFGRALFGRMDKNGAINIGGETIDFLHRGSEPHHSLLTDVHPGTVVSGLMANYYIVDTFNTHFNTDIAPLTEQEILAAAGLGPTSRASPLAVLRPAVQEKLVGREDAAMRSLGSELGD